MSVLLDNLRCRKIFFPEISKHAKMFISLYASINSNKQTELEQRRAQVMAKGLPKCKPIDGVKEIILVSSGKGGVGKSTTAVNLAAALKTIHPQKNIGLLDADVFGPTVPSMMNLNEEPLLNENNLMIPLTNYGIKCMSMGFLIAEGAPLIWRGLMVMQAIDKLLRQVHWESVDYLVVDTPPGTGDTHLSLVQNIPVSGVILVTTPQSTSVQVTKRGATMFKKLNVPIIGVVENMSTVRCPSCLNSVKLFGEGVESFAKEIDSTILAKIPLLQQISECCDNGVPLVVQNPNCEEALAYKELAKKVVGYLNLNKAVL